MVLAALVFALVPARTAPAGKILRQVPFPDEAAGFAFRVETPAIEAVPEGDGSFRVRLAGFDTLETEPGAPDLPTKIVRIAIPEGVTPTLEVVSVATDERRGLRPRPVPRRETDLDAEAGDPEGMAAVTTRPIRRENPLRYAKTDEVPRPIARLGEIGRFRDQRYVEVHLAPVGFDPTIEGLRVATSFEVRVRFDGDARRRSAPRLDPRFESVYRETFLNYAEGTTFRSAALGPEGSASAAPEGVNAGGPIQRIRIRQNGPVRIDFARMSGTSGFLTADLSTWKLVNRGVEVPFEINDVNGNNRMDSGDWIQFYGQALDAEPKAILNTDIAGTPADIFEARDFTDENVYFLTVEAGTRSRIAQRESAPTLVRTPPNDFEASARVETDNAWRPLGGEDPWYWLPTQSNPTQGSLVPSRTENVSLPGLASGTAAARVIVRLRGITESSTALPDHLSQVVFKNGSGSTLSTNNDDGTWDGRTIYTHDFTWPGSPGTLTSPAQVTIQALSVAGGPGYNNQFILDRIEIRYRRLFQASGDLLTFDVPDGDSEFLVSGLSSALPEVWEVTGRVAGSDVVSAVRATAPSISGAGPYTVRFRVDNDPALLDGTMRRFVVFGAGAVTVPANPDFQADTVSDLRQNGNQADLIVIAHPTVLGATSQTTLNQLLSYHASKGITSKIAMLGDVEDEFNDGLPGPLAVRRFLSWVMSTAPGEGWADPKPAFVMLLGDASYDYKGGTAQGNFVPTQILFRDDPSIGYYASDNLMAAAVGSDSQPDLVIARVPARSDAEANTMLQKILNVQQSPPTGTWRRNAILIADRGKRDGTGSIDLGEVENFELMGNTAEGYMKLPPHTRQKFYYYTTYCTKVVPEICDPAAINADIKSAMNAADGSAAVVQTGAHGNFDVWSDDAFWDDRSSNPLPDTNALGNGGKLPWLIAHGCLTGGFHTTASTALGENWIKKSGGGAHAVFAPSSLTFTFLGVDVADSLFNALYGPTKERTIGVPVMNAISRMCGQGSTEACQGYVLLGDPAADLALPTVGPARNVTATGGNARVDLAWTASTTAGAKYDVYRTINLAQNPLTKINASPITGLAYADTGLTNAQTYYYAVVALDAEGFESRWSHFNTDCAVSGPDCLKATPLNPNPPANPSGLVVTDAESGGKLYVSWTANGETDLKYYEIHYGTSPGNYTATVNTGKAPSGAVDGLVNGTTYYVAVTATNTSNLTSGFSQEKTGVPTNVRGVKAPQFISDLRLAKSGNDIVLSWSAVTTNIYGKTATISKYEVYRGTTATFVPGPANLISPTNLSATSFTDLGALAGGSNYHYLVRAVDTAGNVGGLGNQLPSGIDALVMAKSGTTPGNVILSWPAVTTVFSPSDLPGGPVTIDHYEVYARSTLFTRGDIRDGSVPLLVSPTATSVELTPPASTQYYSVVVVDKRGNKSPY